MDRIGPYVIEDELGGGAMGTVYRVRHQELDAEYALKVLKPQLFHEVDEQRFQREMEAMAAVSDVPGVVAIHTSGFDEGQPYYVMDLVQGEDLSSLLRRVGRLPLEVAARYALSLARTLAELHARGLIHRDVKPANIIIDEHDQPRLADFGLSRTFADTSQRLTATGEAIGTPLYMAPEQARGQPVGPPADVYALGMVLFLTVAGVPAVTGQTSVEVLINANAGSHDRLREVAPAAPAELDELCHACFQADALQRPTASEVAAALERFLSELEAGRIQPAPRLSAGALAAIVGLVLLAAGAATIALRSTAARPPAARATDALVAAEAWSTDAEAALRRANAASLPALIADWRAHRDAVRSHVDGRAGRAAGALLVRLELLGGELALRSGDLVSATASLAAARAVEGGRKVGKAQQRAVVLEALIAVAAGDPQGNGLALIDRALKQPGAPRSDLVLGKLRLLLGRGTAKDAAAALGVIAAVGADQVPVDLRCEAALRAGKVAQAAKLLPLVSAPRLRAEVRVAEAEAALQAWDAVTATERLRGVDLRPHPDLARRVRKAVERASPRILRWEGGPSQERFLGMWRELSLHELRSLLDPAYALPEPRAAVMTKNVFNAVSLAKREERVRFLLAFIRLRPDALNPYDLLGRTIEREVGVILGPHPERLDVLTQGRRLALRRADEARARGDLQTTEQAENAYQSMARWEAMGLCFLRKTSALRALVAEALESPMADTAKGYLASLLAGALSREAGGSAEAKSWLAKARELAPTHQCVLYAGLYLLQERGQRAEALAIGRRMARLAVGRRLVKQEALRFTMAMSWLSFQEEQAGNLLAATRAAYQVTTRFGWTPRWPIRHARLLLRTRPPPADEQVAATLGAIGRVFRTERYGRPVQLMPLLRDRAELTRVLDALGTKYPARSLLVHPAEF